MAEGAAGVALALAFALLRARGARPAAILTAVQAALVALAIAVRHQPLAAAVLFATAAVALPVLVARLPASAAELGAPAVEGGPWVVPAGGVLTILCLPLAGSALPLAVALLGVLLAGTRRDPAMRLIGLLVMQNGIALAASSAGGDLTALLAAVIPLVPVLAWTALRTRRPRLLPPDLGLPNLAQPSLGQPDLGQPGLGPAR
jgi:hypothetical protein